MCKMVHYLFSNVRHKIGRMCLTRTTLPYKATIYCEHGLALPRICNLTRSAHLHTQEYIPVSCACLSYTRVRLKQEYVPRGDTWKVDKWDDYPIRYIGAKGLDEMNGKLFISIHSTITVASTPPQQGLLSPTRSALASAIQG